MYSLNKKKNKNNRYIDLESLYNLNGFYMVSGKKFLTICKLKIYNLKIISTLLASPLAEKKVMTKFKKLINLLTELLVSDDDSGDSFREALNQIEKFRLEIKNKYRDFLDKRVLDEMSKKLKLLKKEASIKLIELNNYNTYSQIDGKHM